MKKPKTKPKLVKDTLKITYPATITKEEVLTHIKAALNMWQVKEIRAELGIKIEA